jgi:hypothetical protein
MLRCLVLIRGVSMKRTSHNRVKRARETNLRIKLFDAEKGFIGEFEINPPAQTLPHVVLWGNRVFVQATSGEPGAYYENPAAVYRIPGPAPSVLRMGW